MEDLGVDVDEPEQRAASRRQRSAFVSARRASRARRRDTPLGIAAWTAARKPGECLHMDTYQVKVEREGRMVDRVRPGGEGHVLRLRVARPAADQGSRWRTAIIDLVRQSETQFGCVVKRLYADGGTEFINQTLKAFCAKHGKELHWTPARTQQLNGAAERTVRTFKDYERTMIAARRCAGAALGPSGAHAAFVWNRTHISQDTGMTPYEAMRGKKPSLKHLGVWGCDAYCHVPKEQRSALAPKAEPCIYLGHNEAQNAAYVLLLSTQKVICSRDVTYRSDSFTFMRALAARRRRSARRAGAGGRRRSCAREDDGEPDSVPAQGGQRGPARQRRAATHGRRQQRRS